MSCMHGYNQILGVVKTSFFLNNAQVLYMHFAQNGFTVCVLIGF